ncbi:MAG: chorismate mutase [Alphaproteobacteria bacterium]|jgi:chorismate mutase
MDNTKLSDVRQKIDMIDTKIHDLLMQRAETVDDVIQAKKRETPTESHADIEIYRPAREAEILKNLLKRHHGALPLCVIIGLWRSLLSAFCNMQADFSIAYFGSNESDSLRDAIRYYFGSMLKLKKAGTELSVLHTVSSKDATLGILPVNNVDIVNEWWLRLPKGVYVSGVLPFVKNDITVTTRNDYMIVSHSKPVATDDDKSLFKISGNPDIGRISVINCFGELQQTARSVSIFDSKDLSQRFHLIEVDGFFDETTIPDFSKKLKNTSKGKILDIDYLGSYPAPINLEDYQKK